jgi:hypothetical protein
MGRERVFEPRSELPKSRSVLPDFGSSLPTQLPERTRFERASEAGVGGGGGGGGALLVTLD